VQVLLQICTLHERLVPGYVITTRLEGETRILSFANGAVVRELIVAAGVAADRLANAVVEGPMSLAQHYASLQVMGKGAARSRLVWTTDVLPHERAADIRVRVERRAAVIKRTLEAAPRVYQTAARDEIVDPPLEVTRRLDTAFQSPSTRSRTSHAGQPSTSAGFRNALHQC
jgi:hypothetical protein